MNNMALLKAWQEKGEGTDELKNYIMSLSKSTPRDEFRDGTFYEFDPEEDNLSVLTYKSPDGKVLAVKVGDLPPSLFIVSAGAAFGWSLGDSQPDWLAYADEQ